MSVLLIELILLILGSIAGIIIIMKCAIKKNDKFLLSGMLITMIFSTFTLMVGSDYMRLNNIKMFNPIMAYSGTYKILLIDENLFVLEDENNQYVLIELPSEQAQLYSKNDVINCSFRKRIKETLVDNFEAEVLEE